MPRHLRIVVKERLRADGRVEQPLDPESLLKAIDILKRANVESVAVCYFHAWRDPAMVAANPLFAAKAAIAQPAADVPHREYHRC